MRRRFCRSLRAIEAQLAPLQARAEQAVSLQKALRLAENKLQNAEVRSVASH